MCRRDHRITPYSRRESHPEPFCSRSRLYMWKKDKGIGEVQIGGSKFWSQDLQTLIFAYLCEEQCASPHAPPCRHRCCPSCIFNRLYILPVHDSHTPSRVLTPPLIVPEIALVISEVSPTSERCLTNKVKDPRTQEHNSVFTRGYTKHCRELADFSAQSKQSVEAALHAWLKAISQGAKVTTETGQR